MKNYTETELTEMGFSYVGTALHLYNKKRWPKGCYGRSFHKYINGKAIEADFAEMGDNNYKLMALFETGDKVKRLPKRLFNEFVK